MVCMDQISHAQVTVPPAFIIGHNYQKNHVTVSYLKYTELKKDQCLQMCEVSSEVVA